MSQEVINIGVQADDGTGDTIRGAGIKINNNFTELFARPSVASDINVIQNNISTTASNADIVIKPSGTGNVVFPGITIEDNNIKSTRTNDDIKLVPSGSGSVVIDGVGFSGTSIVGMDSSIININDNLVVDGTVNTGAATFDSAVTINSTLGVDSTTTLSTLTTTGASSFVGTLTIDNLNFNDNIISTASNADLIFTPGGTGAVVLPGVTINDHNVTGTRSNEDLNITASGSGVVLLGPITVNGTSLDSADSTTMNINDAVIIDGTITANTPTFNSAVIANSTLDVTSGATLSTLTVSGASSFVGTTTIDNLTFNDNIISTSSNADLNLTPGGTGVVNVSNLTIDSSINLTDNVIKVTKSNDDFMLSANGTGSVQISKIDMDEGTVDNTVIGGTTPAAATFTTVSITNPSVTADGVTITDNTIKANRSNDDLEFAASGAGKVSVNGVNIPTADGAGSQVLKTDGSGNLSYFTSPILFSHTNLSDGTATVLGNNSAVQVIDSFDNTSFRSAKYHIQISDTTADRYKLVEANVTHDGSTAYISITGGASNGAGDGSTIYDSLDLSADVSGGNVRLLGQVNNTNNQVVKFVRRPINI